MITGYAVLPGASPTHDFVNNTRIRDGRCIAEMVEVVGRHLGQNAAQDLTSAVFWQGWRPPDDIRGGDRADTGAHPVDNFAAQCITLGDLDLQGDVGENAQSLQLVRVANDRRLRDRWVRSDGAFQLDSAEAMDYSKQVAERLDGVSQGTNPAAVSS